MTPFYYCFIEGSGPPRHRHPTQGEAEREAERLARVKPGTVVMVLKCVGQAVKDDIKWELAEECTSEDLPW